MNDKLVIQQRIKNRIKIIQELTKLLTEQKPTME